MSIPAGGQVAGVIGMFLVVPLLGLVSATWRTVLRVIGEEPELLVEPEPTDGRPGDDVPAAPPEAAPRALGEAGPA
jgi:hypothetical protein